MRNPSEGFDDSVEAVKLALALTESSKAKSPLLETLWLAARAWVKVAETPAYKAAILAEISEKNQEMN